MRTIILDRQHAGKPHRMNDMGAWGDLNGDGSVQAWEQEAALTAVYLLHAEMRLRELGYAVLPISDGRYWERHKRANTYAGSNGVYVAAHINASSKAADYGSVFYDHRTNRGGDRLAALVAEALGRAAPELGETKAIPARSMNWTRNAFSTIRGVQSPAICYEPAFLSTPKHAALFTEEGLQRLGVALAEGIHAFIQETA